MDDQERSWDETVAEALKLTKQVKKELLNQKFEKPYNEHNRNEMLIKSEYNQVEKSQSSKDKWSNPVAILKDRLAREISPNNDYFPSEALFILEWARKANLTPEGMQEFLTFALTESACYGRLEVVQGALAEGADPNRSFGSNKPSPLMLGALHGKSTAIVDALMEAGADVNALDQNGYTVLQKATALGVSEMVAHLLEKGADPNPPQNDAGTIPLLDAVYIGNGQMVKALLEAGADVNALNNRGDAALQFAVKNGNAGVSKMLLEAGADVNTKNHMGYTPLHHAVINDNLPLTKMLLAAGAALDLGPPDLGKPEHYAAGRGVKKLLKAAGKGKRPSLREAGLGALPTPDAVDTAAQEDYVEEEPVQALAVPEAVTQQEEPPMPTEWDLQLLAASAENDQVSMKDALAKGANPNITNEDGQSPLLLAAGGGHVDAAALLIESGAMLDDALAAIREKLGQSSEGLLDAARNSGMESATQVLGQMKKDLRTLEPGNFMKRTGAFGLVGKKTMDVKTFFAEFRSTKEGVDGISRRLLAEQEQLGGNQEFLAGLFDENKNNSELVETLLTAAQRLKETPDGKRALVASFDLLDSTNPNPSEFEIARQDATLDKRLTDLEGILQVNQQASLQIINVAHNNRELHTSLDTARGNVVSVWGLNASLAVTSQQQRNVAEAIEALSEMAYGVIEADGRHLKDDIERVQSSQVRGGEQATDDLDARMLRLAETMRGFERVQHRDGAMDDVEGALPKALAELRRAHDQFGEIQSHLVEAAICKHAAIVDLANQDVLREEGVEGDDTARMATVNHAQQVLDQLSHHTKTLVERLESASDAIMEQNPQARDSQAKIDHLAVTIQLYDRLLNDGVMGAEQESKRTVLAGLAETPKETLQATLASPDPIRICYMRDVVKSEEEPDVFALAMTENPDEAEFIGLRCGDAGFSVYLGDSSENLMNKAEALVHHFYGLNNSFGQEAAANGIAVAAEIHTLANQLNNDHRERNNASHPNIAQKSLADFECLSVALQKTADAFRENGPNAGIQRWNREKQRIQNFEKVESENLTPWSQRISLESKANRQKKDTGPTLSLDSL